MIITAFLGFLNIAQNGINSIQQKQQLQQKQLQQKQLQQDNNITYDKPSEESQESFYLEELFGEKPYDKNKSGKSTIT
jgi:hypothetical protein